MRRSGQRPSLMANARPWLAAWLLLAALLASISPFSEPRPALAVGATVSTCDEASFDSALSAVQSSGGGTISFGCAGMIAFSSEKTITTDVTIDGGGAVTFDGGDSTRLFFVERSGALTLDGLSLQNGAALVSLSSAPHSGGAILSEGPLTIRNSTFFSNIADEHGGAVAVYGDNEPSLYVSNSTFTDNSASFCGAIDHHTDVFDFGVTMFMTGSTVTSNSAGGAGAICTSQGVTTIVDSTISMNTSDTGAGAGSVAGMRESSFILIGSTVTGNSAGTDGGAFGAVKGSVTIIDSVISNNSAGGKGGALYDHFDGPRTIIASTFSNNSAETDGGAIWSQSYDLSIEDSTFESNSAGDDGGVFYNGSIDITRSTFSGNTAGGNGGVLFSDMALHHSITASTFSGNEATNGGVIHVNLDSVHIVASTFSGNSATGSGGAIYTGFGGIGSWASIIAGNSAPTGANCFRRSYGNGHDGAIFSEGYNVSDDGSCTLSATGDIQNSSAATVGALADNGGPTKTMLPTGADTLDNADCALSSATDQRGVTRPEQNCDRGAVETATTVPVQILTVYNATGPASEGAPATVTAVAVGPAGASLDYDFDCNGDGSYETQGALDGNSGSAECVFADDAQIEINVRVCDGANCDFGSETVTVANVAPTITSVSNDSPVDEGNPATLTVTATDPAGANDPLTVSADCDDSGDFETVGTSTTVQCGFNEDGSYSVPVQVDDGDGGSATTSTVITVGNANPVIDSATNSGPIDEPSSVTVTVIASDPAGLNDPLQYEFDCDNSGDYEIGPQDANSASCSFADDGSFPVGVRVSDDDGGQATGSTTVSVTNVAPTIVSVSTLDLFNEGNTIRFTVDATDPGADTLTYFFDCDGDGEYESNGTDDRVACTFLNEGDYSAGFRVEDGDGGSATLTVNISIANVAPLVDSPAVDPAPSNEGEMVVAGATFTDPGTLDMHTCTVDYGDGSGPQDGTVDQESGVCTGPAHTYADDSSELDGASYPVTITVTDDAGTETIVSLTHAVHNLPPVIYAITTNGPVPQGQPVTITVSATDAGGASDPLSYAFDCNDDGGYETHGNGNLGSCQLDPATAFSTIGVQVSDDDLGVTTGSVTVSQTATLCLRYASGALSGPMTGGSCPPGTTPLVLPAVQSVTLCINPYTTTITWSGTGSCPAGYRTHIVPGSGPLAYCQSLHTGNLRYSPTGACQAAERAGVIPG